MPGRGAGRREGRRAGRGRGGRRGGARPPPAPEASVPTGRGRPIPAGRRRASGRVPSMFAQPTQNWWWTAHPAAH
ncbi:trp operon leader peptide [Streptomyces abikoensis]